jgi:hypothetical protein
VVRVLFDSGKSDHQFRHVPGIEVSSGNTMCDNAMLHFPLFETCVRHWRARVERSDVRPASRQRPARTMPQRWMLGCYLMSVRQ